MKFPSFFQLIQPTAVVIPHVGPGEGGTVANGGESESPEFLAWAVEHIDPLFPH